MAEQASPRVAYRGFLSYSHRDAGAGAKLHRRLETYKLPGSLVGTETPRGRVPERLTPIFRDREELSAGHSLSLQVQDALEASDSLLVLCSPNAKASEWVGKEIETFRTLHPDRPILAALLEGEPNEAFPAALTEGGAEPIAADLRKGKDGWRLGQQKLIAGMTGVPLDALVQRDAQRQLRRVTAITVGALIAVLVMALLLVAALRARAEADRQRTEAEGLVEYMLTDLRDKLKGVGRLDVMTAVNERAMQHYGKQGDLASLPPESLNRRARILHAMGEDDEKRGDLGLALKKFEEAHRTTAAVLAQKPNDPDAIFAHAQSEYWVGYVGWRNNDRAKANKYWTAYLNEARKLAIVEPNKFRSLMELGYASGNLCDLLAREDFDLQRAQGFCSSAIDFIRQALVIEPDNRSALGDVANRIGWLATLMGRQGKYELEEQYRLQESAVIDRLLALDALNVDYIVRRSWPDIGIARSLLRRGHNAEAIKLLNDANKRLGHAESRMPGDLSIFETKVRVHVLIAEAKLPSDKLGARNALQAASKQLTTIRSMSNGTGRNLETLSAKIKELGKDF